MTKYLPKFFLFLFPFFAVNAVSIDFDLQFFSIPRTNSRMTICFHGYGGNYCIAKALKDLAVIESL